MDLFCPHCTRRVTVSDDKAGQIANCPECSKQFMAPSLTPPAAPKPPAPPPPPPPAPPSTFSVSPPVVSLPPPSTPIAPPPAAAKEPVAPVPPGEYTQSLQVSLRADLLAFVPSACMGAILVLSFFTWHQRESAANGLWTLAFSEGKPFLLIYALLLLLLLPMTLAVALLDRGMLVGSAPIDGFLKWTHLAVALLLSLGYTVLLLDWLIAPFGQRVEAIGLALEFARRLQFLAALASFGLFWLSKRKAANLPPPKLKVRW